MLEVIGTIALCVIALFIVAPIVITIIAYIQIRRGQ